MMVSALRVNGASLIVMLLIGVAVFLVPEQYAQALTCDANGEHLTAWDQGSDAGGEWGTKNDIMVRSHNLSTCSYAAVDTFATMFQSNQQSNDEVGYEDNASGKIVVTLGIRLGSIECAEVGWPSIPLANDGHTETFISEETTINNDFTYWEFDVNLNSHDYPAGHCHGSSNEGTAGGYVVRNDKGTDGSGLLTDEQPVKEKTSSTGTYGNWADPACYDTVPSGWYFHSLSGPNGFEFNQNSGVRC